jgi:hypothetical protein
VGAQLSNAAKLRPRGRNGLERAISRPTRASSASASTRTSRRKRGSKWLKHQDHARQRESPVAGRYARPQSGSPEQDGRSTFFRDRGAGDAFRANSAAHRLSTTCGAIAALRCSSRAIVQAQDRASRAAVHRFVSAHPASAARWLRMPSPIEKAVPYLRGRPRRGRAATPSARADGSAKPRAANRPATRRSARRRRAGPHDCAKASTRCM